MELRENCLLRSIRTETPYLMNFHSWRAGGDVELQKRGRQVREAHSGGLAQ